MKCEQFLFFSSAMHDSIWGTGEVESDLLGSAHGLATANCAAPLPTAHSILHWRLATQGPIVGGLLDHTAGLVPICHWCLPTPRLL